MRFGSALSTATDLEAACLEAADAARADLGAGPVDLCVVFIAAAHRGSDQVPELLMRHLGAGRLVGCTGGGIIGGGREVEDAPAVSVTLARMPGVELHGLLVEDRELPDADGGPAPWTELFGAPADAVSGFVVLPEPFSFTPPRLLAGLDFAYPHAPKVGGIASGCRQPGGHALFLDDTCRHTGAVVLALGGDVRMETVLAQGCRPFGRVGRITAAENHFLTAVDGKPAMHFLQEQLESLHATGVELEQSAPLFLGIAMDPFATGTPGPGDFLIRNVLGYDPGSGMLSIGEMLSVGRQVQLHLRDRETSAQDLRETLARRSGSTAAGALLFSCLGRGRHLYGVEGHDSRLFAEVVGDVPLGGFFCNGEIGPVGQETFLHGYTASFGLFHGPGR